MISVIVTAGGVGSRMKLNLPKQFYKVNGIPLISYTIKCFEEHELIDNIIIVCLSGYIETMKEIVNSGNFKKVTKIVSGGKNGQESIYRGLQSITGKDDDIVLIHDGNRPLVSKEVISNCIKTVIEKGNAIAAIPCKEAMLVVDKDNSSIESYPRDLLKRTQTPHGFYLSELREVHNQANKLGIKDSIASCVLFQNLSKRVFFSQGDEMNFKITTPDDLVLFKSILNNK